MEALPVKVLIYLEHRKLALPDGVIKIAVTT